MDKQRKVQSSEAGSGQYENTSGLEEKSIEENVEYREPDLEEQHDKIERIKEDSDLDRVK